MLKPGTIVGGKYRIRHLLADGGMSEVYVGEAFNSSGRKPIKLALKRLLPRLSENAVFAQMFVQEAELATSLNHRNIVRCHELVRDKGDFFLVMELVIGKEIGRLLAAIQSLPLLTRTKIVAHIGIKVCEALNYVHRRIDDGGKAAGLIHGDLSPQNIMISTAGQIKLYDFGAACALNSPSLFAEGMVNGNLRYMSPEQLAGNNVDAASDTYSLCLVLLEMLQGAQFQRDAIFLNDEVRSFFAKGLSRHIHQRFANAKEMLEALKGLVRPLSRSCNDALLKNLVAMKERPVAKDVKYSSRFFSVSALGRLLFLAIVFGLFIWVIIVVGVNYFEPRLRHNLPYW
ncbi:MAG TPA: serine/threonine-protein kinase [Myxococcota bacterium]|nr:serine/threonine-protein kinase [Myxococcota bacterium]